jgi:hypothetical protein
MERPPEDDLQPVRANTDEAGDEHRQLDLLSIALLVFFVSLIGIVGALLLVPAIF